MHDYFSLIQFHGAARASGKQAYESTLCDLIIALRYYTTSYHVVYDYFFKSLRLSTPWRKDEEGMHAAISGHA